MLSQELQFQLRQQGWSPERRVSIHAWVAQLVSTGFTVLPEAEAILRNFGGLKVAPIRASHDAYAANVITFDPVIEILSEIGRIEFWQQQLGQILTPLGVKGDGDVILTVSEKGQVFGDWGNIIFKYGDSFDDALESSLVFARRKPTK